MKGPEAILKRSALFRQIGDEEISAMLNCLSAVRRKYRKDEVIFLLGDEAKSVGIVLCGQVQVLREDVMGNRMILSKLEEGDLFGETFACAGIENLPVTVMAVTDCEIMLMDYRKVITTCPSSCGFHNKLIENMLGILARKNLMLNQKIEYLAKRSTREKLMAYLLSVAQNTGSMHFTIPYNRQEMADYLCVDRSAMSKELGKMRDEGLLAFHKNEFIILNEW